jgi:hypothetical protein
MFAAAALWLCGGTSFAAGKKQAFDAGARYHRDHSVYEELPFADGDFSYSLGYEYHDQDYYVQLSAGYCPDVGSTSQVDYVITPQANLIFVDKQWEGGVGILNSYTADDDKTNAEWTGLYWQLILGYTFPVFKIPLSVDVYYPFKSWSDIDEFDVKDLEYGATLKFYF